MIAYLSYRIQIAKLNKTLRKLLKEAESVEKGYKLGEDDQGHISHMYHKCDLVEHGIEFHKTSYLKKMADKLIIPMPSLHDETMYKNFDFDDDEGPTNLLTENGIYHVRELIRKEQKAQRDVIAFWFAIITGLIGSIIGLISVAKGLI
ncbi:hypothetical protein [Oceanisphaera sp. W20_SRM_FM3]|uniref:hypothetical protein n=1 Tax=Oceanisphaera sp. W20_SRM_FM3 TaxID=3240267 RepID=UPI003F94B216